MFRSIFCFDYFFFPAAFFVINGVFVTIVTIIIFIVVGGLSFTCSLLCFFFFFFAGFSFLLVLLKGLLIVKLSLDCKLVKSIFYPFDDPFDDGVTLVGFIVGLLKFLTLATLVPFSNCMAIDGIYLAGLLYSIKKKSNTVTDNHFSLVTSVVV